MLQLGFDILNEVFSWITDTKDVIHLMKVCKEFRETILVSICKIQSNPKTSLPSQWVLLFRYLSRVIPRISLVNYTQLMSLTQQLIYAEFDLSFKEDKLGDICSHLRMAINFIKEQKKYRSSGDFFFGCTYRKEYTYSIYITHQRFLYIGEERSSLFDIIEELKFGSVTFNFLLKQLPSCVQEFTYILGTEYPENFSLDSYLERERFATIAGNDDLCSSSFYNYLHFSRNFEKYFTHREYPKLESLEIPLLLSTFDRLRKERLFPNLKLVGLLLDAVNNEKDIKSYLEENITSLPEVIIIYTIREDIRYRVEQWQIGSLIIKPKYPRGMIGYSEYTS